MKYFTINRDDEYQLTDTLSEALNITIINKIYKVSGELILEGKLAVKQEINYE